MTAAAQPQRRQDSQNDIRQQRWRLAPKRVPGGSGEFDAGGWRMRRPGLGQRGGVKYHPTAAGGQCGCQKPGERAWPGGDFQHPQRPALGPVLGEPSDRGSQ